MSDMKPDKSGTSTSVRGALASALESANADIVHAGVFDFGTMFRERRLRRAEVLETADIATFANVIAKWDSGENLLFPGPYGSERVAYDLTSLRPYPFEDRAVAIVTDFTGPQADLMPRAVLKRQVEKAAALGFEVEAAFEFEMIILDETADTLRAKGFSNLKLFAADNRCWSGQTAATYAPFIADLENLLIRGGVGVHALAVELGPGCLEATLRHKPAMAAADDAAFFRMFTKAFCRQRNLTASFMPLMGTAFPGLGGHVSVSLKSKKTEKNAFADRTAPHGLSAQARNFLAGVIDIVPEAFAMCAQTVNAYRRFAPGSWAPKTISWSPYNYTTAIRIACESEALTRMECRLPGADCNVFLTLAMLLGAGLDGLERKLDLKDQPLLAGSPTEIPAGATRLPRDLMEATERLRGSARTREIYGAAFIEHFARLCEAESASLVRSVSPAEIERYLEGG